MGRGIVERCTDMYCILAMQRREHLHWQREQRPRLGVNLVRVICTILTATFIVRNMQFIFINKFKVHSAMKIVQRCIERWCKTPLKKYKKKKKHSKEEKNASAPLERRAAPRRIYPRKGRGEKLKKRLEPLKRGKSDCSASKQFEILPWRLSGGRNLARARPLFFPLAESNPQTTPQLDQRRRAKAERQLEE